MTAEPPNDDAALGFEDALRRLDQAVNKLEGGDLDLDAALAEYERGVRLLNRCRTMLDAAERQVAILTGIDDDGRPLTTPFDDSASSDSAPPPSKARPSRSVRKIVPEDDDAPF
jgi:exodeoxyribonuclease VII small subunit